MTDREVDDDDDDGFVVPEAPVAVAVLSVLTTAAAWWEGGNPFAWGLMGLVGWAFVIAGVTSPDHTPTAPPPRDVAEERR